VRTPLELESAMREALTDSYAESRTWDRLAAVLLADYREALARAPLRPPRSGDAIRERVFVTLDHKPLRRVLRRVKLAA